VHLLEWMPASHSTGNIGLDECARAISDCVVKVSAEGSGSKRFLIGHSLGGTLAAIYGALAPATIRGLVLLGAPLCFQPEQSRFRDALVSLVPSTLSDADPFPGSLLSHMSALASPHTFIWSRLMDAALSLTDHHALEIHARIERWALDEVPLPGKLVYQIIEWLYRENRLCRGTLQIGDTLVARPACRLLPSPSSTRPTRSHRWPRSNPSLMQCRHSMRASLNIRAKSEYACNISAFWLGGTPGRRSGRISSPGSIPEAEVQGTPEGEQIAPLASPV